MKYFITGATGFIGGEVARQLVRAGHEVHALVRSRERGRELAGLGVHLHEGDITDRESMRTGMTGADGVFHVAAWYKIGIRNPEAEEINVNGTRNVLKLMRELKVPKGVYTSTLAVFSDTKGKVPDETYRHDGPWLSEYDRTKWKAHYEVALPMVRGGLPLIIVQPGLVYGPGDTSSVRSALIQYLQRKLPMVPSGTAFCWCHVEDTARGHVLAMERGRTGEAYIIAGPVHTFVEAMRTAERITGIPCPKMQPGPQLVRLMAAFMRPVGALLPLPPDYTAESLRVLAGTTYLGSNEKAKRELSFSPRALEVGLRETLEHEMRLLGMAAPGGKHSQD